MLNNCDRVYNWVFPPKKYDLESNYFEILNCFSNMYYKTIFHHCMNQLQFRVNILNNIGSYDNSKYMYLIRPPLFEEFTDFVKHDAKGFWIVFHTINKYFGKSSDEFKFFINTQVFLRKRRLEFIAYNDNVLFSKILNKFIKDNPVVMSHLKRNEIAYIYDIMVKSRNTIINNIDEKILEKLLKKKLERYIEFTIFVYEDNNDGMDFLKGKLDEFFENNKWRMNKKKKFKRIPLSKGVRHKVFKRDNYTCQECGAELGDIKPNGEKVKLEVDHIYPVSKGGTNDMNNLQTLCWDCNRNKSDVVFDK